MRFTPLLLLLLAIPCWCQTTTGEAKTSGTCSPAVTGSNNQLTITCTGVGREQVRQMSEILNKILANQLNPKDVMSKLDEILNAVDPNKPVITYDFTGYKRTTTRQGVGVDDSAVATFNEFRTKLQTEDWTGLLTLSEKQKVERPEWFTPYFTAGLAFANLCQKEKALRDIEYFVNKTKGVPTFDDSEPRAEKALAEMKTNHWPTQCK